MENSLLDYPCLLLGTQGNEHKIEHSVTHAQTQAVSEALINLGITRVTLPPSPSLIAPNLRKCASSLCWVRLTIHA